MNNFNEIKVYSNFEQYFKGITEPRQPSKIKHLLSETLFISVLAVIAGADDFEDIADFAIMKKQWLTSFLKLPNGVPSHDTFNRILCAINPGEFEQAFIDWISHYRQQLIPGNEKDIIAIDGKTVCNSADNKYGQKAIHMVSALSTKYGLILGQKKCHEKSNEITAIPKLLNLLDIKGTIVTIDAMGTQKDIASKIIEKNGDYILALKANQGNLYKEVVDLFEKAKGPAFERYIHSQDVDDDKGHGRIETRHCIAIENLNWLFENQSWKKLKSVAKITSTVSKNEKITIEERYYISSLPADANLINRSVRKHWHIENKLHWVLDVIFKEDYCRVRSGNGAENLTIIRKIALNKMKSDKSTNDSMKSKRKKASWSDSYAIKIMLEMMK